MQWWRRGGAFGTIRAATVPTQRSITDADARVSVPKGRWGRRRVRVTECDAVLTAEDVYTDLLRAGKRLHAGATFHGVATLGGWNFPIHVEVRPNRVWRDGRVFFVCP